MNVTSHVECQGDSIFSIAMKLIKKGSDRDKQLCYLRISFLQYNTYHCYEDLVGIRLEARTRCVGLVLVLST